MSLVNTLRFVVTHPLNRGREFAAMARFVRWQVGSRLVGCDVVRDWINGSRFLVRTGETGLTGNIYTGLDEFTDMAFLLHVLREDDLFVDVGANVGSYTILACSAVGARGMAFEPVPDSYRRLVENIRLNGVEDRVFCVNKGVGDRSGQVSFTSDAGTMNHALAPDESNESAISVEVTSLDAELKDAGPAILKIDVEGYEAPVLRGAEETLKKSALRSVIIELNGSGDRYGFDETRIVELMLDHGFEPCSYSPFDRQLIDLGGKNADSGNTLFIRDRPFIEERLRTAPRVSVLGRQF